MSPLILAATSTSPTNCNDRIRKVSNGVITTVAGGGSDPSGQNIPATSAQLAFPLGIAVDSAGSLYFAELYSFNSGNLSEKSPTESSPQSRETGQMVSVGNVT